MSYDNGYLSDISGLQKIFRIPSYKKIQKKKLSVYVYNSMSQGCVLIANQAQLNRQAKKLYTTFRMSRTDPSIIQLDLIPSQHVETEPRTSNIQNAS